MASKGQQQGTDPRAARAARAAELREKQQRQDKRRRNIIVAVTAAVVVVLVGAVVFVLVREQDNIAAQRAAAEAPIDGVQTYGGELGADLTQNHVTTPVQYEQTPPVGGDHNAVWQNCGVYTEPVTNENAVHSLEHGAVWITYSPDLPQDQVDILTEAAESDDYMLLSPFEGLETPIVASAWGAQLPLEDAADPRLERFMGQYLQGEQTPEPGASCFGGVGEPA